MIARPDAKPGLQSGNRIGMDRPPEDGIRFFARMKRPLILLAAIYLIFVMVFVTTAAQLPERVATHFGGGGTPDAWMSRKAHLLGMGALTLLFPGFVLGMSFIIRYLPASMLSLPNRDYWRAPNRLPWVYDFLFRHSLWFAALSVAFVLGIHLSIVDANKRVPMELSTEYLLIVVGFFLAAMAVWILTLLRPFLNLPADRSTTK